MPRLSRRSFLSGAMAALAGWPAMAHAGSSAVVLPENTAFSGLGEGWLAATGGDEGFSAVSIDEAGRATPRITRPVRFHGLEASPDGALAVAVGRRPGHLAIVFDRKRGGEIMHFTPGEGRVFAGHGRFSPDARFFFTTEIERPRTVTGHPTMGRGVLSQRDVANGFAIVAEWPTAGDGPHDLMQSGPVLIVANGGIEPHTPEARDAEETGSTLSLLDPESGEVRAQGQTTQDFSSLSLRHLAIDGKGGSVVAAQDLLKDGEARPLLFHIGKDATPTPFDAPDNAWRALRGYVGSVAYDASGRYVACASPRGGRVAVWQANGRYVGAVPLVDGCGLAMTTRPGAFIAASGYGELILIQAEDDHIGITARHTGGPRFDNHMVRIG
ncbi:DUF1513 domain-containing protein [Xanthobacter sp. TB0139]|uniref:DUF1513 domain-containing protein n=1 Tax=Xanthobacter sp. TB0139 TaxID=3459178 RepID=UPI004039E915